MKSSILAFLAALTLGACVGVASADDGPQIVPLPIPQSSEVPGPILQSPDVVVESPVAPQSSYIIPRDGKWARGMIANDGAQFSGAAPYNGPYIGGTWEGPTHIRYPYYSYRRNWDYAGPVSVNVTIMW